MPRQLHWLPDDIILVVASFLDVRSYVHFGRANKRLHNTLRDESTARKCVERSIPYSAEVVNLHTSEINCKYLKVLMHTYDLREALRTAKPCSVSVLANVSSVVIHGDVIAYSVVAQIRVLDLRSPEQETVIFHDLLTGYLQEHHNGTGILCIISDSQVQSLGFGIVSVLCSTSHGPSFLFAINYNDRTKHRILLCEQLRSTSRLFVRHDARYLYYGTHSASGSHFHHEWLIQGFDLESGDAPTVDQCSQPITETPLQLPNFVGSDTGLTVSFLVQDGHFFALTNQTSFESEEVDWTSNYHYICFPVNDPNPDLRIRTMWRRQHEEGPMNDVWNDQTFQIDEETGELLVVECRKEYLDGSSVPLRTCYSQPWRRAKHGELSEQNTFPMNSQLSRTLDRASHSTYSTARLRIEKYTHHEYAPDNSVPRKEYIRSKTKWKGYSFNAQAFVDLVTDDVQKPDSWRTTEKLKLRVASRLQRSPLLDEQVLKDRTIIENKHNSLPYRPRIRDEQDAGDDENLILDSEEAYTETEIFKFPPDNLDCEALDKLMCPLDRLSELTACLGQKGLIYMAGGAALPKSSQQPLVLLSFDPSFGFEGMKRLDGKFAQPKTRKSEEPSKPHGMPSKRKRAEDVSAGEDPDNPKAGNNSKATKQRSSEDAAAASKADARYVCNMPSMFYSINQGIWLR